MDLIWNTTIVKPHELITISRGDKNRMLKYLYQFQALIPSRIVALKESLEENDRIKVRQLLHQMKPQIQFFGIDEVVQPINKLELEYASMPMEELSELINNVVFKLKLALKDVDSILNENF